MSEAFGGAIIRAGGFDGTAAQADIAADRADLVAFSRPFISNPAPISRVQGEPPLAAPDFASFYTPGAKGYADYPGAD